MVSEQVAVNTAGVIGVTAAALVSDPLVEVFNGVFLVQFIMGAAGGMTRGIALSLPWKAVLRGVVLGALIASGFGTLGPHFLNALTQINIDPETSKSLLAPVAYATGLMQDIIISKFVKERENV